MPPITVLRLGRWFGTGPYIWLNLQQAYELDLVREETGSALENILPRQAAGAREIAGADTMVAH